MKTIFIDANVFTYLLTGHPTYGSFCQDLLEKVEQGSIEASISPLVIDEVSYVLMVQTTRRTGGPHEARSMKIEMLKPCKIALCLYVSFMAISMSLSPKDI